MTIRAASFVILLLCRMSGPADAECLRVASGAILAGDLAAAVPAFAAADPALPLAAAPIPGTQRVLSRRDLAAWARRSGLLFDDLQALPNLCIQRSARTLSRQEVEQALRSALHSPTAAIDLLDFTAQPVPEGSLEFDRAGLSLPPEAHPQAPVIWRGRLVYDGRGTIPVWARVRISVERAGLIAIDTLRPGRPIGEGQVAVSSVSEFPFPDGWLSSVAQAAGRRPRRVIPAGQRIPAAALEEPNEIESGDRVQVKVQDGLARLSFESVARSAGRRGETIRLLNPVNGRTFRARVEGKGLASLQIGPEI